MNTGEWMVQHGLHKCIIEAEEKLHGQRCATCDGIIDGEEFMEDEHGLKYHDECYPDNQEAYDDEWVWGTTSNSAKW